MSMMDRSDFIGLTGTPFGTGRGRDNRPRWTPEQERARAVRANAAQLPFQGTLGFTQGLVPPTVDRFGNEQPPTMEETLDAPFFGESTSSWMRPEVDLERVSLLAQLQVRSSSLGDLINKLRPIMRDEDQTTQLQLELVQLGYLERPTAWGVVDDATLQALNTLAAGRYHKMDRPWHQFLQEQLYETDQLRNVKLEQDLAEAQGLSMDELEAMKKELESFSVENVLTNSMAAEELIDNLSKDLIGKELDPEQKQALIAQLHAKEREHFRTNDPRLKRYKTMVEAYNDKVAELTGSIAGGDDPTVPKTELDAFMQAIKTQESGGNPTVSNRDTGAYGLYQFVPKYWRGFATGAGEDPSWPPSPETQEKVARHWMARYYRQFGNWRDVAVAWYGGPGAVGNSRRQSAGQGKYPTINSYAAQALQKMEQIKAGYGPVNEAARLVGQIPGIGAVARRGIEAARDVNRVQIGTGPDGNVTYRPLGGMTPSQRELLGAGAPALQINEYEAFDAGAYLASLTERAGGADVEAYRYLQGAQEFEDLLGGVGG